MSLHGLKLVSDEMNKFLCYFIRMVDFESEKFPFKIEEVEEEFLSKVKR